MLFTVQEKPLVTLFVRKFRNRIEFTKHQVYAASKYHDESFYDQECRPGFTRYNAFLRKWDRIQAQGNLNFTVKIDYRYWVRKNYD